MCPTWHLSREIQKQLGFVDRLRCIYSVFACGKIYKVFCYLGIKIDLKGYLFETLSYHRHMFTLFHITRVIFTALSW